MGKMKEYLLDLADRKEISFEEITQDDLIIDFKIKAQKAFGDSTTSKEDLEFFKDYLPSIQSELASDGDVLKIVGIFYLVRK